MADFDDIENNTFCEMDCGMDGSNWERQDCPLEWFSGDKDKSKSVVSQLTDYDVTETVSEIMAAVSAQTNLEEVIYQRKSNSIVLSNEELDASLDVEIDLNVVEFSSDTIEERILLADDNVGRSAGLKRRLSSFSEKTKKSQTGENNISKVKMKKRVHENIECPDCDKKFFDEGTMQRHRKSIHSKREFKIKCDDCKTTFAREDWLNQHYNFYCKKIAKEHQPSRQSVRFKSKSGV